MPTSDAVLNLSMRHIRVFMTAADLGSFTKAADVLYMTQSMVSKSIMAMEKNLEMKLFVREASGVSLTPSGKILYQSWHMLLRSIEQTIALAHATEQERPQQIIINDFSTSVKKAYLWPYVARFRELYPEAEILIETSTPGKSHERLENKNCDVAFAPAFEAEVLEQHGAVWKYALRSPHCVWVHKSNKLYDRESIEWMDLKDETFIVSSPYILTNYDKWVYSLCRNAGFEPNMLRVVDPFAATMNLKLGNGVVIRDHAFDSMDTRDVKRFDLPGPQGGTIIAWSCDLTNPCAKAFISLFD